MTFHRSTKLRLAVALFASVTGVSLAQSSADAAAKARASAADAKAAAKDKSRAGGAASLQDLLRQLHDQRDTMIADHEALAKKLKDATEAEKKTIKERMEAQMKAFEAQQSALHKQIRDEQRRQRQTAAPKR